MAAIFLLFEKAKYRTVYVVWTLSNGDERGIRLYKKILINPEEKQIKVNKKAFRRITRDQTGPEPKPWKRRHDGTPIARIEFLECFGSPKWPWHLIQPELKQGPPATEADAATRD